VAFLDADNYRRPSRFAASSAGSEAHPSEGGVCEAIRTVLLDEDGRRLVVLVRLLLGRASPIGEAVVFA